MKLKTEEIFEEIFEPADFPIDEVGDHITMHRIHLPNQDFDVYFVCITCVNCTGVSHREVHAFSDEIEAYTWLDGLGYDIEGLDK